MNIDTENKKVIPINSVEIKKKKELEDFFEEAEEFIPEIKDSGLLELLSMSDKNFEPISNLFLEELERSLNNPEEQIAIAQAFNLSNVKKEDLAILFDSLVEKIDEEKDEILSPLKKDFLKKIISISFNVEMDSRGISKRIIDIPIEIEKEAKIPAYAKAGDAGMDIYALDDYDIECGETKIIPTGIKVAIPKGYALLIQPRSGMSAKSKLRIANTPGLIDSGYRDEIGVIVENIDSQIKDITYDFDENGIPIIKSILHGSPIHIEKGQRFAQMRLVEVPTAHFFKVDDVKAYEGDRHSGFGGTGDK